MRTLPLFLAACAIAPTALASAPSPARLEAAFGSTIVSTYPDGRTALLWLKRDGTYDAKGRHRTASSGRWTLKDDRMCLKQLKPVHVFFSYCTPLPSGTTWNAKAVTGEKITVRIVKGTDVS